eukprot:1090701-Pyramimonas_sp.AAC.1
MQDARGLLGWCHHVSPRAARAAQAFREGPAADVACVVADISEKGFCVTGPTYLPSPRSHA